MPDKTPGTPTGRKVIAIYGGVLCDDVLGIEAEAASQAVEAERSRLLHPDLLARPSGGCPNCGHLPNKHGASGCGEITDYIPRICSCVFDSESAREHAAPSDGNLAPCRCSDPDSHTQEGA
jgi:hypothetical protein